MFLSKPFAYLHVPGTPIYVGELVMAIGILEARRHRGTVRAVVASSALLKTVLVFAGFCALRLASSLTAYRLDAVRDAALFYYAGFAILVATAVELDPGFLVRLLRRYYRAIPWFVVWAPLSSVLARLGFGGDVFIPGTNVPVNNFKPGDICVHLSLAVLFLWFGVGRVTGLRQRRYDHLVAIAGVFGLFIVGTQSRGGMVSGTIMIVTFGVLLIQRRLRPGVLGRTTLAVALGVAALGLSGLKFELGARDISYQQITRNVLSVGGRAATDLDATAEWRKRIWGRVIDDTLTPENAFGGRGFGPNLYDRYRDPATDPEFGLRNPHNSHLSVLARTGVTGVVLWTTIWVAFAWTSYRNVLRASVARSRAQLGVAVWTSACVLGTIVNAFFDPTLEGPHAAIWMWVMVGLAAVTAPRRVRPRKPPTVEVRSARCIPNAAGT
jgi:hypothetical protein